MTKEGLGSVDQFLLITVRALNKVGYGGSPDNLQQLLTQNRFNLWEYLKTHYQITSDMIGVDVGAGDGSFAQLSGIKNIFSSDLLTPNAVHPPNFIQNTAENLPFASSSLDFISYMYALHHFANKEQSLCEAKRVLKPGGFLFIKEEFPRYKAQTHLLELNEVATNEAIFGKERALEYCSQASYFDRSILLGLLGQLQFSILEESFYKPGRWYEPIYKTIKVLIVAQSQ